MSMSEIFLNIRKSKQSTNGFNQMSIWMKIIFLLILTESSYSPTTLQIILKFFIINIIATAHLSRIWSAPSLEFSKPQGLSASFPF